MFGNKLKLWREPNNGKILIDTTPTGREEERFLFETPVSDPRDLNDVILRERMQNMGERIVFADRAFLIAFVWVVFLIVLPFAQMIFSIWGHGLTDPQFVTVITTTTASVFGFWYLVGRYLFPTQQDTSTPKQEAKADIENENNA